MIILKKFDFKPSFIKLARFMRKIQSIFFKNCDFKFNFYDMKLYGGLRGLRVLITV